MANLLHPNNGLARCGPSDCVNPGTCQIHEPIVQVRFPRAHFITRRRSNIISYSTEEPITCLRKSKSVIR
jgi:hypothetical protein